MPLSLDRTGLIIETLGEIVDAREQAFRDEYGTDFAVDPEEPAGQFIGIESEREAAVQAALAAVYANMDKRRATGAGLVALAQLHNTVLADETFSHVAQLRLIGTPTTVVAGRVIRHEPTDTLWDVADATIGGGGDVLTTATAQVAGPTSAVASTTAWEIETPVSGWTGVESLSDASLGSLEESDEILRARIDSEAATRGRSTIPSGRSNIMQDVAGVTSVIAINNPSAVFVDGVPPGSVEYVVTGGSDADVASAVWRLAVAGGVQPWGSTLVVHPDDDGINRDVRFSRSNQVTMHIRITVDTTGAEFRLDAGDPVSRQATTDAISASVVALATSLFTTSKDVVPQWLLGTADPGDGSGTGVFGAIPTLSATSVTIEVSDDGASWQTAPFVMGTRDEPQFATDRVTLIYLP